MEAYLITARIIVTWRELHQLGINGLLKDDIVYISEMNHHTSSEFGQCALAVDAKHQREWAIPLSFLELIE